MQKTTPWWLRIIRLTRLLFHVASGLLQSIVYPYASLHQQQWLMRRWANGVLAILNIRLRYQGELPSQALSRVLFAANHVSWLDICVLMAICPTRFVAKMEISRWPLLGMLARNTGTLFIQRSKRSDTARINQKISEVLKNGERVTVFPEGTTTDGTQIRHFHASLLQSAVAADAWLYPVAIRYCDIAGAVCQEAAYVEPSLVLSLQKILSQMEINAELIIGQSVSCGMKNRRELARLAEQAIATALSIPVIHRVVEKSSDLPGG